MPPAPPARGRRWFTGKSRPKRRRENISPDDIFAIPFKSSDYWAVQQAGDLTAPSFSPQGDVHKASWQRDLVSELDALTASKLDASTAAFLCAAEDLPEAGTGDVSRAGARDGAFGLGLWLNLTKNPRTKVRQLMVLRLGPFANSSVVTKNSRAKVRGAQI
jgi:hypothetical protein